MPHYDTALNYVSHNDVVRLTGGIYRVLEDEEVDEIDVSHLVAVFSEYPETIVRYILSMMVDLGFVISKQDGDNWYFYTAPRSD
jgi:hypothetical protein